MTTKSKKCVGVVGAGGWGTALAVRAAQAGYEVVLWCYEPEVAEEIKSKRTNERYLAGVEIPSCVEAVTDFRHLEGCRLVLLVVPSKAVRSVARGMREAMALEGVDFVSCTKGIDLPSGRVMTEVWREELGVRRVLVLSGPNIAPEVARGAPAAAVLGYEEETVAEEVQGYFQLPGFRIYTSGDAVGIQLGGALKNVYAIAAGCVDGFGLGDNAKAALVTRCLAEMMRFGTALGGRRETFAGLSGIGDLMVTCFSPMSRNRRFGERLGKGETPEQILASTHTVAEGVPTAKAAYPRARELGVETPVLDGVCAVLEGKKTPREVMQALLERAPKPENL